MFPFYDQATIVLHISALCRLYSDIISFQDLYLSAIQDTPLFVVISHFSVLKLMHSVKVHSIGK